MTAYLYPRDPNGYSKTDGICSERSLRYRIWYQGKPRKIGDLSLEELRGALLDAQDDLNLVCLKLYGSAENETAPQRVRDKVQEAIEVAKRHRVFKEEEEALDAEEAEANA